MQFAVISDVHGNRAALEAALSAIDRAGVSDVLNLGDSLSGPFDPSGTADLLLQQGFPTVCGNHDRMLLDPSEKQGLWEQWTTPLLSSEHLEWVASLPEALDWNGVHATHAVPGDDAENWLDRRGPSQRMQARDRSAVESRAKGLNAPLILTGHTHTPRMVRLSGNRVVVNPGSIGCPAYLDDRSDPPFIHETGAPDARYAIITVHDGDIDVALCSTPYDPTEMQALARAKGADSWAEAIGSGWFTPPEAPRRSDGRGQG